MAPDGTLLLDIGLDLIERVPGIEYEFLAQEVSELRAGQLRGYDALFLEAPRLGERSLDGADRLAIVARFGVGYDGVDVDACTANGTLLTITPDGVRRPMAVAAVTLVLSLSQWLVAKDRLVRDGRWDERGRYTGVGLEGRTLGAIGLGNIGREVMRLVEPLEMRRVAFDPYVSEHDARGVGAELTDLDTLLAESDFVLVLCSLTTETRGLLDERRLALMKPTAFLVNVARGPIVDQAALTRMLMERRIAGAGLDVFDPEPVAQDDPLVSLDNVILTAHALGWTDRCFLDCGRSAFRSILAVAEGTVPQYVVNGEVLEQPRVRERLEHRARQRSGLATA